MTSGSSGASMLKIWKQDLFACTQISLKCSVAEPIRAMSSCVIKRVYKIWSIVNLRVETWSKYIVTWYVKHQKETKKWQKATFIQCGGAGQ